MTPRQAILYKLGRRRRTLRAKLYKYRRVLRWQRDEAGKDAATYELRELIWSLVDTEEAIRVYTYGTAREIEDLPWSTTNGLLKLLGGTASTSATESSTTDPPSSST